MVAHPRYITSQRCSRIMFEVLIYLYESYFRPEACPEPEALAKKLLAIGFEEEEISKALIWLKDLAEANYNLTNECEKLTIFYLGTRIYAQKEIDILGSSIITLIQFLESAKIIDQVQRELVIERALAETSVSLEKLKIIILIVLWSQGKEPDGLMFDELFLDEDDAEPRQSH